MSLVPPGRWLVDVARNPDRVGLRPGCAVIRSSLPGARTWSPAIRRCCWLGASRLHTSAHLPVAMGGAVVQRPQAHRDDDARRPRNANEFRSLQSDERGRRGPTRCLVQSNFANSGLTLRQILRSPELVRGSLCGSGDNPGTQAPAATGNCRAGLTPIAASYRWEDDEVDGGPVETLPHAEEAD